MTVADHLNQRLKPKIEFEPTCQRDDQAHRRIGPVVQFIIKIGHYWTWLITKDNQVVAGEYGWQMTPEDAAKAADDFMEAADARRD